MNLGIEKEVHIGEAPGETYNDREADYGRDRSSILDQDETKFPGLAQIIFLIGVLSGG